jgi:hypothetical protein
VSKTRTEDQNEDRHAKVCTATITLAQRATRSSASSGPEGRVKVNHISAAQLSRLAHEYLLAHRDDLFPRARARALELLGPGPRA